MTTSWLSSGLAGFGSFTSKSWSWNIALPGGISKPSASKYVPFQWWFGRTWKGRVPGSIGISIRTCPWLQILIWYDMDIWVFSIITLVLEGESQIWEPKKELSSHLDPPWIRTEEYGNLLFTRRNHPRHWQISTWKLFENHRYIIETKKHIGFSTIHPGIITWRSKYPKCLGPLFGSRRMGFPLAPLVHRPCSSIFWAKKCGKPW